MQNLLLLVFSLFLVACAAPVKKEISEQEYYESAQEAQKHNNYYLAVERLQDMESRYPFGHYAEQAQLELIYAQYQSGEMEGTKATSERFIRLHPQHDNADYAYYMRGLATYNQGVGLVERFFSTDQTQRDPGPARDSFQQFAELINRFPDSKYVADAKARMLNLKNRLARYEIHVSNYYIKRHAYLAAANHARNIVEHYQGTPAVADALSIMAESYTHLGLDDLAQSSIDVLRLNYPKHSSFDEEGKFVLTQKYRDEQQSFFGVITFGLFN
jgi:outer membrane protein assembly factor BamD